MTSLSLDAGDWEVVDCPGNPVPGDPDAVTALAHQFLNQAGQAQERAAQLTSVHTRNEGQMQGDYAEGFENILARLPSDSTALGKTYQSGGEALNLFAAELDSIQSQASEALQRGTEADAEYRSALDDFCSVVPLEFTGTEVWRGLNAETATDYAQPMADETEDPELLDWAAEVGQYAGAAEDDRQAAVAAISDIVTDYQDSVSRCSQALQNATSTVPPPQLSS
jgi:uncharacterized protein YukE